MKVHRVPAGRNLDEMLVAGELQAAIYPEALPSQRKCLPEVGLLFADPKAAEMDYYRKTGIFPIMHTIVIRNEIIAAHPWMALSLVQGFERAKEACYRRMRNPRVLPLAWAEEHFKEQQAVFGDDPWPYTVEENRVNLEVAISYAFQEGMIKAQPRVEELFVPSTLRPAGRYIE